MPCQTTDDDRLYAAVILARDIKACEALLQQIPVPRHRLMPGVLLLLGEPQNGPPLRLDDDLAIRVDLTGPSPRDRNWSCF